MAPAWNKIPLTLYQREYTIQEAHFEIKQGVSQCSASCSRIILKLPWSTLEFIKNIKTIRTTTPIYTWQLLMQKYFYMIAALSNSTDSSDQQLINDLVTAIQKAYKYAAAMREIIHFNMNAF